MEFLIILISSNVYSNLKESDLDIHFCYVFNHNHISKKKESFNLLIYSSLISLRLILRKIWSYYFCNPISKKMHSKLLCLLFENGGAVVCSMWKLLTVNTDNVTARSHGLVVKADGSWSRGREFEPRHRILDGCKR